MRIWLAILIATAAVAVARAMPPGQQVIIFGKQGSASGSGGGGSGACTNGNLLLDYSDSCQLMSQMVGN